MDIIDCFSNTITINVWRGDYISIVIYYYDKPEYDLYINGFELESTDLYLTADGSDQDTLKYYFTQFNLLENITIDSLNEYTIDVLAKHYQSTWDRVEKTDESYYAYKDALEFISKLNNNNKL